MKKEDVDFNGFLVAIIGFIVVLVITIVIGLSEWSNQVAAAKHSKWSINKGVVTQVLPPHAANRPVEITYGTHTVSAMVPKRAKLGMKLKVVSYKNQYYIPFSTNNNYDNPFHAVSDLWPTQFIILVGVLGNFVVWLLIGVAIAETLYKRTNTIRYGMRVPGEERPFFRNSHHRPQSIYGMRVQPTPKPKRWVHTPDGQFEERDNRW